MSVSRRRFLGTSAATVSASLLARAGGAQHPTGQQRPSAEKTEKRNVGPQPEPGAYAGSLLILFEGLCAFVTDPPPADKSVSRKLDVGLVSTSGLVGTTTHEHLPTLSIDRTIITAMRGIAPAAADVQNTHFNLKGKRIRFVPAPGTKELVINDAVAVATECPQPAKRWTNFNWLLDVRAELDDRHQATLLEGWRTKADVIDAIVELRHGSVEDESLYTPDTPGNDSARVFNLPAASNKRALKEQIRALIAAPRVAIEVWPLGGRGTPAGVIELDCGMARRRVTVSQLPVRYIDEGHNMGDLAAYWLLTTVDAADQKRQQANLPQPLDKFCPVSSTNGCGCCPMSRFVETKWNGEP